MGLTRGYTQTDVGLIPEGWQVSCVRNLISDGPKNGYSGRTAPAKQGTPTLSLSATSQGRLVLNTDTIKYLEDVVSENSDLFLSEGDILVQRSNTAELVGTTAVFDGPNRSYIYPDLMMRLRFRSAAVGRWFWRYANSERGRRFFKAVAAGSTGSMPKISGVHLQEMPVPLPPREELTAVVEALDDIDALIESLERLIAKKREIKQGAMQELLTGKKRLPGFGPQGCQTAFQQTEAGPIPADWNLEAMGELFTFQNGVNADKKAYGSGIPFANVLEVITFPTLEYSRIPGKVSLGSQAIEAYSIRAGDVLFNRTSETQDEVGLASVYVGSEPVVFGGFVIRGRPRNNRLHSAYAAYGLRATSVRGQIIAKGQGAVRANIGQAELSRVLVPLPSPPEQRAIADVLSDMDAEIEGLATKLSKARQIKHGMTQALLTGKIRLVRPASAARQTPVEKSRVSVPEPKHNQAFNEAVVLSILTKKFGSERYPLGRFRRTKLLYLFHRHAEGQAEGYLKKAAGPYNPAVKYRGPEGIALKKGYVRAHSADRKSSFVVGENVTEAGDYFGKWYNGDLLTWLEQFRLRRNEELELLTTVDMAIEDLRREGVEASVESVRQVIQSHPEWQPKLERSAFSDANLRRAIEECRKLFPPSESAG